MTDASTANATTTHAHSRRGFHGRDMQSLLYMVLLPTLVVQQWLNGWVWWQYAMVLFLSLGTGIINHNHAHLPMWRNALSNRCTSLLLSVFQGHPAYVFHAAHNNNHHRYHHGEQDVARTYRFPGGDSNNLLGYVMHPLYAACALYPLFFRALGSWWRHTPRRCLWAVAEYILCVALWAFVLWMDAYKALLFVMLPQLFGLHWLLATNYLQHAHADGNSPYAFARNFDSPVLNTLLMNIGLHTAHHLHPAVHWAHLPVLHHRLQEHVPTCLTERSLCWYMLRVFVGGLVYPPWRTRSLRTPSLNSSLNDNGLASK